MDKVIDRGSITHGITYDRNRRLRVDRAIRASCRW